MKLCWLPCGAERDSVKRSAGAAADGRIESRVDRLATERRVLFDKLAAGFGLSSADWQRLHEIERELDEFFLARRRQRAARDADRFDRDPPFVRGVRLPR